MTAFSPENHVQMLNYYASGITRTYRFRKEQLKKLKSIIQEYEQEILTALHKDLHKSAEEAYATEVGFIYKEINYTLRHLEQWMADRPVASPFMLFPSKSKVIKDPWGICLIIAPWNYPFQLLMAPLIGSIAGGNCAVLKPSEMTPHTAAVVNKMITDNFDPAFIKVIEGEGAAIIPAMLHQYRFDFIFFTGSTQVGRKIAILAAEKLVPTCLELGGKSPCIIDKDADIEVAARRIAWGKFTNAGQTCVAPDYLLVHTAIKDLLVLAIQKSILSFYGVNPQTSPDYGRIINNSRLEKLISYLSQGKVIFGGTYENESLYFSPTLIDGVKPDSGVMKEEIFGPVLPIITFDDYETAMEIILQNPHPLSLYYFGRNKAGEKFFMDNVAFGGGCINNTLVHLSNEALPFGGIGNSGSGMYHGQFSFDIFTRSKSILKTGTWMDPGIKYPPYKGKLSLLKWLMK